MFRSVDALIERAKAAGVAQSSINDLVDLGFEEYEQLDFLPFDPAVKRTEATIKTKDNALFKVWTHSADSLTHLLLRDIVTFARVYTRGVLYKHTSAP